MLYLLKFFFWMVLGIKVATDFRNLELQYGILFIINGWFEENEGLVHIFLNFILGNKKIT